jgi:hypothetical protein
VVKGAPGVPGKKMVTALRAPRLKCAGGRADMAGQGA